jgi:hypothetical protein
VVHIKPEEIDFTLGLEWLTGVSEKALYYDDAAAKVWLEQCSAGKDSCVQLFRSEGLRLECFYYHCFDRIDSPTFLTVWGVHSPHCMALAGFGMLTADMFHNAYVLPQLSHSGGLNPVGTLLFPEVAR